jgi:hypothetical protein
MPTIISGDGTITGLTSTGISAAQTVSASNITTGTLPSAQLPAGSVLQVVSVALAQAGVSTSSSTYTDTGLTLAITPKFSTSKILVIVSFNDVEKGTNNTYAGFRIVRDSTVISAIGFEAGFNNSTNLTTNGIAANYLDSPATTSATTYKVQFNSQSNNAYIKINAGGAGGGNANFLTLMEIAG